MSYFPLPASDSTVSLCYCSSTSMLDHSRLYYSYRRTRMEVSAVMEDTGYSCWYL